MTIMDMEQQGRGKKKNNLDLCGCVWDFTYMHAREPG